MLYYDGFTAGNKDYKLRINIRSTVTLEKKIGGNPLSIFGAAGDKLPTIETMVTILHCALQQYHHGITFEDAMDIFDTCLSEGHSTVEFIPMILEIYKVSGIIGDTEKNV